MFLPAGECGGEDALAIHGRPHAWCLYLAAAVPIPREGAEWYKQYNLACGALYRLQAATCYTLFAQLVCPANYKTHYRMLFVPQSPWHQDNMKSKLLFLIKFLPSENPPYWTSQAATVDAFHLLRLSANTAHLVKDKTPSLGGDAWCMSIHSWVG